MDTAIATRKYGSEEPRIIKYDTYEQMVESIRQEINTTEKLLLRIRWFVGCQAYIIMEGRKYGDHSVEEFAADLNLSPSSIYEARRFYMCYTREELDARLISRQFTYRRALAITRCKDPDMRELIEDASYEQNLSDEEVESLVKAANGGQELPKGTARVKAVAEGLLQGRKDVEAILAEREADADEEFVYNSPAAEAVVETDADALREIRFAAGDAERACQVLCAAAPDMAKKLDLLDLLSEESYTRAEKALLDAALAMRDATLALYAAQTAFARHNIVLRG